MRAPSNWHCGDFVGQEEKTKYTLKAQLLSLELRHRERVHLIISSQIARVYLRISRRRRIMIIKLPHYHFGARMAVAWKQRAKLDH
jgi:hypothetical protein